METKGSGFLKVTGIFMIIGGVLGAIFGILALLGVAALAAISEGEISTGLLYIAGIISLLSAVVQLIAGIIGVKNCKKPEKAGSCIVWGCLVILFSLIGSILTVVGGSSFPTLSFLVGLILPGLYIFGAVKNRAA